MGDFASDFHITPPANPGAGATAYVYDTTWDSVNGVLTRDVRRKFRPESKRLIVCAFIDQAATLFVDWKAAGSTNWRPYDAAGYAITASTFFQKDCLFLGDDTRVRIVTVTGPGVWEISGRLTRDRGLG
ncbi:MAG TPA: hypothetical protein VFH73_00015, partial [Polyangia bacterium]|nr:hypothetical protein [Polyangia bacterium]